jgi:hypothetical protein
MMSNLAFCAAACGSVASLYDTYGPPAAILAAIIWGVIAWGVYVKKKRLLERGI